MVIYRNKPEPSIVIHSRSGNEQAVLKCLREGVDIDECGEIIETLRIYEMTSKAKLPYDKRYYWKTDTALIAASRAGHLTVVKILLDHGANIHHTSRNTRDDENETALEVAQKAGHIDCARLLEIEEMKILKECCDQIYLHFYDVPSLFELTAVRLLKSLEMPEMDDLETLSALSDGDSDAWYSEDFESECDVSYCSYIDCDIFGKRRRSGGEKTMLREAHKRRKLQQKQEKEKRRISLRENMLSSVAASVRPLLEAIWNKPKPALDSFDDGTTKFAKLGNMFLTLGNGTTDVNIAALWLIRSLKIQMIGALDSKRKKNHNYCSSKMETMKELLTQVRHLGEEGIANVVNKLPELEAMWCQIIQKQIVAENRHAIEQAKKFESKIRDCERLLLASDMHKVDFRQPKAHWQLLMLDQELQRFRELSGKGIPRAIQELPSLEQKLADMHSQYGEKRAGVLLKMLSSQIFDISRCISSGIPNQVHFDLLERGANDVLLELKELHKKNVQCTKQELPILEDKLMEAIQVHKDNLNKRNRDAEVNRCIRTGALEKRSSRKKCTNTFCEGQDFCMNIHHGSDLPPHCRFNKQGDCWYGDSCQFNHLQKF